MCARELTAFPNSSGEQTQYTKVLSWEEWSHICSYQKQYRKHVVERIKLSIRWIVEALKSTTALARGKWWCNVWRETGWLPEDHCNGHSIVQSCKWRNWACWICVSRSLVDNGVQGISPDFKTWEGRKDSGGKHSSPPYMLIVGRVKGVVVGALKQYACYSSHNV